MYGPIAPRLRKFKGGTGYAEDTLVVENKAQDRQCIVLVIPIVQSHLSNILVYPSLVRTTATAQNGRRRHQAVSPP